jgi:hypothetical chaperone protein
VAATDGKITTAPLPLDNLAADPTVFRSLLYFPNSQICHYGTAAIAQYCEHEGEGRLVRSIKKYLPSESFIGSWIDDRMVKLEDLIGFFLLELRKRASALFEHDVTSVMLGRPARFSPDPAKDRLAEYRLNKAAEIAGFKRIEFLAEPLAAAFDLRRRREVSRSPRAQCFGNAEKSSRSYLFTGGYFANSSQRILSILSTDAELGAQRH